MVMGSFKEIVYAIARNSKCEKKQVGAIIVKGGRIISSGYNGTPRGYHNCNEIKKDDHRSWQFEHEIHAEMNAILWAARSGIAIEGATMITTTEPCTQCAKHIANSGIKKVIYFDSYPVSGVKFLRDCGIVVEKGE